MTLPLAVVTPIYGLTVALRAPSMHIYALCFLHLLSMEPKPDRSHTPPGLFRTERAAYLLRTEVISRCPCYSGVRRPASLTSRAASLRSETLSLAIICSTCTLAVAKL